LMRLPISHFETHLKVPATSAMIQLRIDVFRSASPFPYPPLKASSCQCR
jgi:hypothetical protein